MLWFPTKKEVKKEFIKIKNSFKKRDSKILALEKNLNDLKKEIVCRNEIELMIRKYLVQSEPNQHNELNLFHTYL